MKIKMVLTLSKALGFLIIIIGSIYAMMFRNANVLTEAFFYSALLVATKTIVQDVNFTDIFKSRKANNNVKKKYK